MGTRVTSSDVVLSIFRIAHINRFALTLYYYYNKVLYIAVKEDWLTAMWWKWMSQNHNYPNLYPLKYEI